MQRRVSFSLVWWGNSLFQLPARKFYLHGLARFGLVSNFHLFGLLVSVNNLSVRWVELEATTRTSQGIFFSSSSLHAESETDKGVNTCCARTSGVLKKTVECDVYKETSKGRATHSTTLKTHLARLQCHRMEPRWKTNARARCGAEGRNNVYSLFSFTYDKKVNDGIKSSFPSHWSQSELCSRKWSAGTVRENLVLNFHCVRKE